MWSEHREEVKKHIDQAQLINLIVNSSDDTAGNRIVNISIQIPCLPAFYWETINTGTESHSAEGHVSLLKPIIKDIVSLNTLKINVIITDINFTMRKFHCEMAKRLSFSHVFYTLCDSHGFQLLIKDILQILRWKEVIAAVLKVITFFKKSKL